MTNIPFTDYLLRTLLLFNLLICFLYLEKGLIFKGQGGVLDIPVKFELLFLLSVSILQINISSNSDAIKSGLMGLLLGALIWFLLFSYSGSVSKGNLLLLLVLLPLASLFSSLIVDETAYTIRS